MAKDPAFLFYTSDFLTGTMLMNNEQKGIYITLLCVQHQHGGMIDKISFDSMVGNNDVVRIKFLETEDGFYNKRLMDEMIKRRKKSNSLSKNAMKRWEKEKVCKGNAIASDLHMPIEDEDEDVNKDKDKDINKDINKDNKGVNKNITIFFDYYLKTTGKQYKLTKERKDLIKKRLLEGYTIDKLKKAVDNFVKDDWEGRADHMDLIYCIGKQRGKPDNLEKWINKTNGEKNGSNRYTRRTGVSQKTVQVGTTAEELLKQYTQEKENRDREVD